MTVPIGFNQDQITVPIGFKQDQIKRKFIRFSVNISRFISVRCHFFSTFCWIVDFWMYLLLFWGLSTYSRYIHVSMALYERYLKKIVYLISVLI